ncbi:hypothetical protein C8R46DRAFT_893338, partial [Mycena filopes]
MSSQGGGDRLPRNLKLWQQNLDRGLDNQHELLQTMGANDYHFAALQEPHIDFRNMTRGNSSWRVVYPSEHGMEGRRTRAVTLVNVSLSTNSWTQMPFPSPDAVAIEFRCAIGTIRIVNVYNDGDHDETL